jgi:pimeloyl-ACP methyl ester carboxylesterase
LTLSASSFAQSVPENEQFDPVAVVNGITIDRSECAALERNETAVWVEIEGQKACMRYYAAGLKPSPGPNPVAVIWMNGDVLGPKGNKADKRQKGFGPTEMVAQERKLSSRFGAPMIFLGRPGTYGSAGKHHTMRGRPVEALLVNAAIDILKQRYDIQSLALGGHSGGGTLVAEMLARRGDLSCAVISSGAPAYRAYLESRGFIKPGETLRRFDPYTSLDNVPSNSDRRIFVIGDPRETNVPFSTQELYYKGLVARGHAAWILPLQRATDARYHNLVDFGETAIGMCAAGASTDKIIATLEAMPDQRSRVTN